MPSCGRVSFALSQHGSVGLRVQVSVRVHAIQVGDHAVSVPPQAAGYVLLAAREHRRMRVETAGEHLVVGEVRARPVRGQSLLRVVQRAEPVGQRRQRRRHGGHVFRIVPVQVADGRQAAVISHECKASAHVARGEALVRGVVVRVRVRVMKLVRHSRDRGQMLERSERCVSVRQTHA